MLYPRGPKAQNYTTYGNCGNFYAIPATVKNPKEIAEVMKVLFSIFDKSKGNYITLEDVYMDIPRDELAIIKDSAKNMKYTWFSCENNDVFKDIGLNLYHGDINKEVEKYSSTFQIQLDKYN